MLFVAEYPVDAVDHDIEAFIVAQDAIFHGGGLADSQARYTPDMVKRWSRKLTRELRTIDGQVLRTLKDAADFATDITDPQYSTRPTWQAAAARLMEAAEGGDVEKATTQVETALFWDMRLDLKQKKSPTAR